jgi:hypothetical protein
MARPVQLDYAWLGPAVLLLGGSPMTRPRATVARLMAIVLFVGFGFAVLRNNADQNAEIAALSARIERMEPDATNNHATLAMIIKELRQRPDLPDGYVFHVDYERREALINVSPRSNGMRKAGMQE